MSSIYDWSTTPASNATSDGDMTWAEGMAPSAVNNSARQLIARVAELLGDIGGALVAGGTANGLTVTANSDFTTYANGRLIAFKAASDNTGAATLNVNGIGAKAIRKMGENGDEALSSGDIQADGIYVCHYNSSLNSGAGGWQILNAAAGLLTAVGALDSGSITSGFGSIDIGSSALTVGDALLGSGASTGGARVEIGLDRTGDGNSFVDFHSQVGTDFDARIIRSGGANGALSILNNGTGGISFGSSVLTGVGSGLTTLNASNLSSGTVPDARFPATLPAASGANLTALNATNLSSGTVPDGRFPATLPAASGANLTALNASNLASGTVASARVTGSYTGITGTGALNAGSITSGFGAIDIGGDNLTAGSALLGSGVSTGGAQVEVGADRTGNGPAFVDLHGQVGTDWDARIIRNGGVNGSLQITNNGTGGTTINTGGGGVSTNDSLSATGTFTTTGASVIVDRVGAGNSHLWLRKDGVSQALLFHEDTGNTVILRGYADDGSTVRGQLTINRNDTAAAFNGALTATSFSGSGASLTALNASNVSSGTLAVARLDSTVWRDGAQPTTAQINTIVAGSAYQGLGTYGHFVLKSGGSAVGGQNVPGSSILGDPPGTWKCMGVAANDSAEDLWLRVA